MKNGINERESPRCIRQAGRIPKRNRSFAGRSKNQIIPQKYSVPRRESIPGTESARSNFILTNGCRFYRTGKREVTRSEKLTSLMESTAAESAAMAEMYNGRQGDYYYSQDVKKYPLLMSSPHSLYRIPLAAGHSRYWRKTVTPCCLDQRGRRQSPGHKR